MEWEHRGFQLHGLVRARGGVQVRPLNHSRVYFWWSRSVRAGLARLK